MLLGDEKLCELLIGNPHYQKLSPLSQSMNAQLTRLKSLHGDGTGFPGLIDSSTQGELVKHTQAVVSTAAITWTLYSILTTLPKEANAVKRGSDIDALESLLKTNKVGLNDDSDIMKRLAELRVVKKGTKGS